VLGHLLTYWLSLGWPSACHAIAISATLPSTILISRCNGTYRTLLFVASINLDGSLPLLTAAAVPRFNGQTVC